MPLTKRHTGWTGGEDASLRDCCGMGMSKQDTATLLNVYHHGGKPVRNANAVSNRRSELGYKVAKVGKVGTVAPVQGTKAQEVSQTKETDKWEAKSLGTRIKTVDDLIRHIEADLTRFEIERQEATKYETTVVDPEGKAKVIEMHRVFVRLKPKSGPNVQEAVQAVIDGAFAKRTNNTAKLPNTAKVGTGDLMQALVIADPHLAKLAWAKETGHSDYDLSIACTTLREASHHLIERGAKEKVAVRHIYLLGDVFHFDTPTGTTTKGTPLERDGRVQKMIQGGSKALFDVIEESAKQVPTHIVLVSGNHDEVLSWALQQILQSHFRHDQRVTVDGGFTSRKYVSWGKCLLGLTHGDKAKKVLPGLMAREAPGYSTAKLREIHRGHLHYRKETDTVEGVLIRQHPSLSPPDAWHSAEGFISDRGQDAIIYHKAGAVVATHSYTPDL